MARVNPGRLAAARVLLDVEGGAHAEDALAKHAPKEGRDRGVAWHLCLGVLRRRGELHQRIEAVANRPCQELDRTVRVALEVGTLLYPASGPSCNGVPGGARPLITLVTPWTKYGF